MKSPIISGRYELKEIVGTGGMSVVYRAWDLKYNREVGSGGTGPAPQAGDRTGGG